MAIRLTNSVAKFDFCSAFNADVRYYKICKEREEAERKEQREEEIKGAIPLSN
jgi:hypothetical protein